MDEAACLLGYQDTSSFYRAFREWEGMTSSRWRKLNGAHIDRLKVAVAPAMSLARRSDRAARPLARSAN
ncbi:hypothetical protein [Methylosinus sp. C49]|uniref:hypothetical protein n=1 Tax=Methylosinus sp. C49 TaxID=2699395 RepID=UPI0032B7C0C1